jgi:hypothetical protein
LRNIARVVKKRLYRYKISLKEQRSQWRVLGALLGLSAQRHLFLEAQTLAQAFIRPHISEVSTERPTQ